MIDNLSRIVTVALALLFGGAILVARADVGIPAKMMVPMQFYGEWKLEVQQRPGFPWWQQMKYPKQLSISSEGISFRDQVGDVCKLHNYLYDDEIKALVFTNCLPAKSDVAFTLFYRVKFDHGQLVVEVWTYKMLFRLHGRRSGDTGSK